MVLVDKGKLESSGAWGAGTTTSRPFSTAARNGHRGSGRQVLQRADQRRVSAEMISRWVRAMPPMLDVLQEIGVEFVKNPDGSWLRTVGFGEPGNW